MVVWKEQEHELDDICAVNDQGTVTSLSECGLIKFFKFPSMRAQVRFLEYILKMWNPEQQHFEVGAHILTVELEDIYFLAGLSRWGEPIYFIDPRGGDITTQGLIDQYYFLGTQMSGKKIPIKNVMDLPFRMVLFTMQRISSSQRAHQESREHMLYAL